MHMGFIYMGFFRILENNSWDICGAIFLGHTHSRLLCLSDMQELLLVFELYGMLCLYFTLSSRFSISTALLWICLQISVK